MQTFMSQTKGDPAQLQDMKLHAHRNPEGARTAT